MASGAVWGIDIGQCAVKALRCHPHEDGKRLVADAFDYIEYSKILSQPGSDPGELIGDALKQFLSRNTVLGDRVAVSVSGQAGLARFIKLPPVEAKKIPDIVRYEARQQIPFDLNDVIWDYQRMGIGSEEEGFALETEVGLFAMKREAVFRALDPFVKADIEVDIVQLTPLVLYNFLVFDQLGDLPPPEEYDSENPPESLVVISLGTDATDLVISNGYRVWQRSIPLGGNHFTKALTKELKLTFAKAEHLKRNATAAADPKAVFQAMRPVFSDLLTELQRSIGYFSNLDRAAKIGRVIGLGNAMKLPGLRRYLSQSLGYEIEKIESFPKLVGSQVVTAPSFQENLLSFPVAYGLSLQGLNKGAVHTNLLPKEIIYDRLVKRKKPWAVAAAALLLLACSISFGAYSLATGTVDESRWKDAEAEANRLTMEATQLKGDAERVMGEFKTTDKIGQNLVGNVEGRIRWLELLKAVNECLPTGEERKPKEGDTPANRITLRRELHVTNLECQQMEDVSAWYAGVKSYDTPTDASAPAAGGTPGANAPPGAAMPTDAATNPDPNATGAPAGTVSPTGPGWIIQMSGYHYHNDRDILPNPNQREYPLLGAQYVRKTLIERLRDGKVELPSVEPGVTEQVSLKELGISYPVLVGSPKFQTEEIPNPNADVAAAAATRMEEGLGPGGMMRRPGTGALPGVQNDPATAGKILVPRFNFTVQFCWQPKTPTERNMAKKAKEMGQQPGAAPNGLNPQ